MPVLDLTDTYGAAFEALERTRENDPSWLRRLRQEAFGRFQAQGFPTTKQEEWRFTNVAPLVATPFRHALARTAPVAPADTEPFRMAGPGWTELVFVNGHYRPEWSRQAAGASRRRPAIRVASIAETLAVDGQVIEAYLGRARVVEGPFAALNTAFVTDGALVHVPADAVMDGAIHLLFYSDPGEAPAVSHPRILVVAEPHSRVRILETHASRRGTHLANAVTEVVVGAGAAVDHYKIQREAATAFHVASTDVRLGRDGRFTSYAVTLGARIGRNEITAALEGEGADCTLNGIYLADGERLVDNHTAIDHATPNCTSHEVYKGILDGRARGVFNGKIFVRPDAQKTDAKQTNKVLLLSDAAQIDTKPQLEIFADDVKCTHGAAVGQLDEEALFYLRARGIGRDEARALLIYAFASDVVSRIELEPVRHRVDELLRQTLAGLHLG